MKKVILVGKRLGVIVAMILAGVLLLTAGNLDHDEYIEVNLVPQTRMPYYYEN